MLTIDGSMGEGGGQVLRSALGLSLVTGTPFRIENIRHKRKKPGLMRQHLTAVQAAAQVGGAEVRGDRIGSSELWFEPAGVTAGDYEFAIGTAGSTSLVLQAILPGLLVADGSSQVTIEGGTHNPYAPPFEFLVRSFAPVLARMGACLELEMVRPGFYPAGGGCIRARVEPVAGAEAWRPLQLEERGAVVRRRAIAQIANLPRSVAERELRVIGRKLGFVADELEVCELAESRGPGNLVTIVYECEHVTEVFTGFGELGKPAERVATDAVHAFKSHVKLDVPVGRYLADQLLIPFAMARGGSFRTAPLSRHTRTNLAVVSRFLPLSIAADTSSRAPVVRFG